MAAKSQVIALEEHYLDPEVKPHLTGIDSPGRPHLVARLEDVGQGRLAEMDAAGIDMQVLSHAAPSLQKLPDAELAVRLARAANDRLAETVAAHPDRFAGSPHCRPLIRSRPRTNWSAPLPGSGSRVRWCTG